MKIKNKGKVYPSPSSSSTLTSSYSPYRDAASVLKLLPAAILALASVLSLEDREVLAYLITRSIKTTNPSSPIVQDYPKKKGKKQPPNTNTHKPPLFDCDCFECYTSYWYRWDSSPNRELIHQAIEAFEDHLSNGELSKRNARGKKKDRSGRRVVDKPGHSEMPVVPEIGHGLPESFSPEPVDSCVEQSPENDASPAFSLDETEGNKEAYEVEDANGDTAVVPSTAAINHKGLARKVLPDVLGLFNSRLWSLWSPDA